VSDVSSRPGDLPGPLPPSHVVAARRPHGPSAKWWRRRPGLRAAPLGPRESVYREGPAGPSPPERPDDPTPPLVLHRPAAASRRRLGRGPDACHHACRPLGRQAPRQPEALTRRDKGGLHRAGVVGRAKQQHHEPVAGRRRHGRAAPPDACAGERRLAGVEPRWHAHRVRVAARWRRGRVALRHRRRWRRGREDPRAAVRRVIAAVDARRPPSRRGDDGDSGTGGEDDGSRPRGDEARAEAPARVEADRARHRAPPVPLLRPLPHRQPRQPPRARRRRGEVVRRPHAGGRPALRHERRGELRALARRRDDRAHPQLDAAALPRLPERRHLPRAHRRLGRDAQRDRREPWRRCRARVGARRPQRLLPPAGDALLLGRVREAVADTISRPGRTCR
jgi:hypothetical protein